MIVLAFASTKASQALIQAACEEHNLPAPSIHCEAGYQAALKVTIDAQLAVRAGESVTIVGDISEVRVPPDVPADAYTDAEWRLAWLAYIEACEIGYMPVGNGKSVQELEGASTSTIRKYQRAVASMTLTCRELAAAGRALNRHVCGRPPYGYLSADGRLIPNPIQVKYIKRIFKMLRDKMMLKDIIEEMRSTTPEFWDRVKVRRILGHKALYCRGEYRAARGGIAVLPELAILPPTWESAKSTPRSVATVSPPTGSGTLGA